MIPWSARTRSSVRPTCVAGWLVLLPVLSACGVPFVAAMPTPTPTCREEAGPALAQLEALFLEWSDAATVARNTGRLALSGPVATLQEIRRRAVALDVPPCVAGAHRALIAGMNATLEGFVAFMAQADAARVNAAFDQARVAFEASQMEIATVLGTAPPAPAEAAPAPPTAGADQDRLDAWGEAAVAYAREALTCCVLSVALMDDAGLVADVTLMKELDAGSAASRRVVGTRLATFFQETYDACLRRVVFRRVGGEQYGDMFTNTACP